MTKVFYEALTGPSDICFGMNVTLIFTLVVHNATLQDVEANFLCEKMLIRLQTNTIETA